MTLPEFAKQKLPANAPVPGGGHDHGEAVPLGDVLRRTATSSRSSASRSRTSAKSRGRWCGWSTSRSNRRPLARRPGRCPRRAATSAAAAAASARIRRTRTSRRSTTGACCSSRSSTPACVRSTFAIRSTRRRSAITSPQRPRRPTSAASDEGADERCKVAIQSNNVEVDDRGYVYVVDRANTGMHIVELTGAARRVANFPAGSN